MRPDYRVGEMVWYWAPGVPESIPPLGAVITADMGPGAAVGLYVFQPPGVFVAEANRNVWAHEVTPTSTGMDHRFARRAS